jgi:hypothetical protein
LIAAGDAPALENEAEHHNEEGRGDRIVQAIILCDGVDDFHGTPDLKTGNPVAANSFPVFAAFFCRAAPLSIWAGACRERAIHPAGDEAAWLAGLEPTPASAVCPSSCSSRSGDAMRRKIHEWMVGSDPYVLGLAGDAMLAVLTAAVITGGIRFVVGFL